VCRSSCRVGFSGDVEENALSENAVVVDCLAISREGGEVDKRRILVHGTAALMVPLVLEASWISASYRYGPSVPGYDSLLSQAVCTAVGSTFLANALRGWAIPAALIYLPLMFAALVAFALGWNCSVYSNCL